MQTHESHHKKNYLARVNKWYNGKLALVDEKLLKKAIPPKHVPPATTSFKKQNTLLKKKEDLDNDNSPVKKIKLEKSPINKTRFPPIARADSMFEAGGESPYRKYYEDSSLNKRRAKIESDDNFGKKIISLKQTPGTAYDAPYKDNLLLANRRGLELWKNHREKKIILNRSQEQLQRSITKWGNQKSSHHERSLMVADRHSIVYNDHSRSWKHKPKDVKKDDLNNSLFISQDKFLESDNDTLSSDGEDASKTKTRNNQDNDYSFDAGETLVRKLHDMTFMSTDHDVMFNSLTKISGGNDSFFITKKDIEEIMSPTKKAGGKGGEEIKQNAANNPIRNLNRIQKLRHMKGELIGANKVHEQDHIDSIFNNETSLNRHISLSLYTRPKSLLNKRTLGDDYEDETFGSISLRKTKAPMRNSSVEHYQSNHSAQRTNQINEINNLKHQLTGKDINCSVMTIQKAILFPEDRPEEQRAYPKIGELLFHNPFETKKKKKKKGKKKKK